MIKSYFRSMIPIVLMMTMLCLFVAHNVSARIEWEVLKQIPLADTPLDIAISNDGATAYILSDKNILIYRIHENIISDTIPVGGKFSQIAVSEDGERLFVTDVESKQVSIIKVSLIHEIETGQSPAAGC